MDPGAPQPARPDAGSPGPSPAGDRGGPLRAAAVAGAMVFFYWVADRLELERVVPDLASNAPGASQPGGAITLDVAGCSLESPGAGKLPVP